MKKLAKRLCGGVLASFLALILCTGVLPSGMVNAETPKVTQLDFTLKHNANGSYTVSGIPTIPEGKILVAAAVIKQYIEDDSSTPQEYWGNLSTDYADMIGDDVRTDAIGLGNYMFEFVDVNLNRTFSFSSIAEPNAGIYFIITDPVLVYDYMYSIYSIGCCPNPPIGDSQYNNIGIKTDVTGVSLNKSATTLKIGESESLVATIAPDNATDKRVGWTSDKESVAIVDSTGKITAKAEGKATITVTTLDGNKTKTCEVTVTSDSGNTPSGSGKVDVPKNKEEGNFGAGGLANTVNEIKNAVLTKEDKDAMAEGKNINVWAEITKQEANKVKDAEKQKIMAKLPSTFNVGTYLDIKLFKQMTGDDVPTSIEKTNGKVKIKFTVPKELQKGGRTYDIIRLHDGEATVLGVTREGYELTIETDGFSTYALIYSDNPAVSTNANKAITSPKTGESSTPYAWIALMMASAFVFLTATKKREA